MKSEKKISDDLFRGITLERFLNHNGKIISANQPVLTFENRAFRYGDSIFESIRVANGKIKFLDQHIKRLIGGLRYLKMENRQEFSVNLIGKQIIELAQKNNIKTDARVRFTVFRSNGGLYTPETNSVSYLIEIERLEEKGYILNKKGYAVDIYTDIKKGLNKLSNLKSGNALTYVLAGIYKTNHQLNDCILLNETGNIAEAISSNVFIVKEKVIFTPPLNEGCVDGIMRNHVIKIAKEFDMTVYETPIPPGFLNEADEVFLSNAINGIKWVGAYQKKRYYNNTSKLLAEKLSENEN
jgi:branched-subunit amino acid aminotransferase/4-amino-4-deoxychorismate lyase